MGRVVACGTLLVEQKFIHGGGKAGHIEDVVVEQCFRGLGIGQAMVELLVSLAQEQRCYKVLLSCRRGAEGFYGAVAFGRSRSRCAEILPLDPGEQRGK